MKPCIAAPKTLANKLLPYKAIPPPKTTQTPINAFWCHPNISAYPLMNSIEELCGYYIALLRTAYLIHQGSHWTSSGSNFYGNHLLFERLYTNSAKDADAAAEKMIGVFGDATLNLSMQAQLIGKMMAKYSTSSPLDNSIKVEKAILEFSDKLYETLEEDGKLSLGLDDFIMSIASNREEAVYLLQQAMKEGSKIAKRKESLKLVSNASEKKHKTYSINGGPPFTVIRVEYRDDPWNNGEKMLIWHGFYPNSHNPCMRAFPMSDECDIRELDPDPLEKKNNRKDILMKIADEKLKALREKQKAKIESH